jgi:hypothetical protein
MSHEGYVYLMFVTNSTLWEWSFLLSHSAKCGPDNRPFVIQHLNQSCGVSIEYSSDNYQH